MGGLARRAIVLLVLNSMFAWVACTGTRITLFKEPTPSYLKNYLERQADERTLLNHEFAGFTDPCLRAASGAAPPRAPPGFTERTVRVYLGRGRTSYKRARDSLLQWRVHDGSTWAKIVLGCRSGWRSGSQIQMATVVKACAGLAWCINPCQVLYERRDKTLTFLAPPGTNGVALTKESSSTSGTDCEKAVGRLWAGGSPTSAPLWASFIEGGTRKGTQTAVAYATKEGHLIQGEERLRVVWFSGQGGDDSVWFEVFSVSRGAGLMGGIVFPFVRSMQKRFFREQAETMRRIVGGPP